MQTQKTPVVLDTYPRPQMVREKWMNLNGTWAFAYDVGNSGIEREFYKDGAYPYSIQVPFCPESALSGIENKDFMTAVWYKRTFALGAISTGERVLLHFGAVDYKASVWVNGVQVGTHVGGYTPFTFDITATAAQGENTLVVCAQDDVRDKRQPSGKQSEKYHSYGCFYTRVTGIWQTVWLEVVPERRIDSFQFFPDYTNGQVGIDVKAVEGAGCCARAAVYYQGRNVGEGRCVVQAHTGRMQVALAEKHAWMPGAPHLYDVVLTLEAGGQVLDRVESYFGLRTVTLDRDCLCINGKRIFQRLVLDQGYYPDGIYTAPSDEAIVNDIKIAMELGFNGARLHEKVVEPRVLYWADKLGYLLWSEFGNWGLDITTSAGLQSFLPQWVEAVQRDFNHPSIIGWCPFNETWDEDITPEADGTVDAHKGGRKQNDLVLSIVYDVTKQLDGTRPVIDTSGNYHVKTDIFDIHDYSQDCALFVQRYGRFQKEPYVNFEKRQRYGGQPYMVSEFGGIWWNPGNGDSAMWGYGERPKSEREFLERYRTMIGTLLQNPRVCGFCYTQLYDVEQEVNGLYTYDRRPKFDPSVLRAINTAPAAIEKEGEGEMCCG